MVVSDNHRTCVVFRYLPGYKNRIENIQNITKLKSIAQLLEKKEPQLVMYENLKQHLNPHFLFNSLTSPI